MSNQAHTPIYTPMEAVNAGLKRIRNLSEIAYTVSAKEITDASNLSSLLEVIMEEAERLHSISNRMRIGLPVDGQEVAK